MGLAVLLIVLGIILWIFVWPIIGIILLAIGVFLLLWASAVFGGRRRTWY